MVHGQEELSRLLVYATWLGRVILAVDVKNTDPTWSGRVVQTVNVDNTDAKKLGRVVQAFRVKMLMPHS